MNEQQSSSFTGYRRTRKTKLSVILLDRVSKRIIQIGGIGVILAVSLVFVHLSSVVVPLFQQGSLVHRKNVALGNFDLIEFDPLQTTGFSGLVAGRSIKVFLKSTGEPINEIQVFETEPTSFYFDRRTGSFAAGFYDGSIQLGSITFETSFYEPTEEERQRISERGQIVADGQVKEITPEGQVRVTHVTAIKEQPLPGVLANPVLRLDRLDLPRGPVIAGFYEIGRLFIRTVTTRFNFLTGEEISQAEEVDFSIPALGEKGVPDYFFLFTIGETALLLWKDGTFLRVDLTDPAGTRAAPVLEGGNIFDGLTKIEGSSDNLQSATPAMVTYAAMIMGRGTVLIGDSQGRTTVWHLGRDGDAVNLVPAHLFQGPAPVTAISTSIRKRMIAVGYEDGTAQVIHVTSNRLIGEAKAFLQEAVYRISIFPRDDAIGVLSEGGTLAYYTLHEAYPEFSLGTLFTPVLYEGNVRPMHIWQSTSGTDAFEPKFGLIPLVVGTLKAAFFSLIFGVPIAILAAIYTSEFLHPDIRAKIKPLIEMMASLPSVVLGFLAGLVIAPFVEDKVPSILFSFFSIPLAFILAGYGVQFLSKKNYILTERLRLGLLLLIVIPVGIFLAMVGGPWMERLLFYGNLKAWLNEDVGRGMPGWFLLLLPVSILGGALFINKIRFGFLRREIKGSSLIRFLFAGMVSIVLAGSLAWILDSVGIDSRSTFPIVGELLGTYVQRNALVVGIMMGFAIIPIIYTLAEDALKSVPNSLRSASLALGATPWQTTIRIVIPTAMSGIFSAIMIGFGRAVGETMIVLMATGNTAILDWNPFSGLRTLTANIAIELPEAVVGSTHFRILFLASLTLFIITFIVNTIAELQRLRYRAKAIQL